MRTTSDGNGSVPRHLEASDLISLLDGELERGEQESARTHLEGCWNCRSRLLAVENSIENFLRVREQILPDDMPPAPAATALFRRRLNQHREAPISARLQIPGWMNFRKLLAPISSYPKSALATAAIAIAVTILAIVDPFKSNTVSADELLTRASAYEFLNEASTGKVVRARTRLNRINLATRIETNLAEIQTDADNMSAALHVSIARTSGTAQSAVLRDREKPSVEFLLQGFPPQTIDYLRNQRWLPQVSVAVYQRLIAGRSLQGNQGISATRRDGTYEVHHSFAPEHPSHITEAVLTINAQTYAPQSVSLFTVEGAEHFEYRLSRTSIESVDRTPEIAKLFEGTARPTSEAARSEAGTLKSADAELESSNSKSETTAAGADLEVEVLRLLNQAGADLGEQISVTRQSGGPVIVTGLVETEKRRNEILRALQPVDANPAVRIEVKTVAQAIAERKDNRSNSSRPVTVEGVEVAADVFPAYQDLRARMSDEDARVFAARMVSRSHIGMRHAWALKRLMSQFSPADLAALRPEAHAKWIALVQTHAREFERETAGLRIQLQPIFASGADGRATDLEINNDAELMRAVDRLVALASTNYEVVRAAFTVTRESSAVSAIKTPQFWQSLRSAEEIAGSISRAR